LQQGTERFVRELECPVIADRDIDSKRNSARLDDSNRLWMAILRHKEVVSFATFGLTMEHHHRLGSCRSLIQKGCVGYFHARQIDDHRLIVQQRLEAPLGNLCLIGRVLRVPGWILQDATLYDRWSHRAVIPHTDVAAEDFILAGQLPGARQQL